ncbi:MAG: pseudouridine synthase [Proteobacteria bacterium]|nr:pseudouridine synthase [Pseudomonadota bacterium]
MRINRFFTDQGICSRREADRMVEAGRITINGKVAIHGDQIQEGDEIRLDGKIVGTKDKKSVIIAFNKPAGVECTSDPEVPNNIITAVNYPERVFHIGRLDKMSEGLILLTNIGDIVNKILRRRYGHEKEYIVIFDQPISHSQIQHLQRGVELDDGPTAPCKAERMGSRRLRIILTEGRNRQIRRMAEALGFRVMRLKRIRVMNITLGDLPKGRWRELNSEETASLLGSLSDINDKV